MRYKAPSSEWTRRVSLIVNSKRYAYWPELGRSHFMFPQERNHPLRYAQVSAQRLRTKGPSRIRLVVIDRPSRRGWHRFIRLRNLSVGLQPKPQVLSVERTRSRRGSFAVTTPRPGCNASRRACCGQAQDLCLQPRSVSSRRHHRRFAHGSGRRACPIGRVMSRSLRWIVVLRISWSRTVWSQEP